MYFLVALISLYLLFLIYSQIPHSRRNIPIAPRASLEGVSVIIPFKNEASNLPSLLRTIRNQHSTNLNVEYVFVDDHSTDGSQEHVEQLPQIKGISAIGRGKKNAIREGIEIAKFDWILTLDADVRLRPTFVQELEYFDVSQLKMIIFPIRPMERRGAVSAFFDLEFIALQATGIGMAEKNQPILSNGACLFFEKKAFLQVDQDRKDYIIPSGDDIFSMFSFVNRYGKTSISVAKGITPVDVIFPHTFSNLFNQRSRWISKTLDISIVGYQLLAFAMASIHLSPLVLIIIGLVGRFSWAIIVPLILIKWLSEWCFFSYILPRFQRRDLLFWLPLTQLLYPFYIFSLIANGVKFRMEYHKSSLDAT